MPQGRACSKGSRIGSQPAPYRGLSGPRCRKSFENLSRGLRPVDPKTSPKSLGDSLGSLRRVSGECFWTFSGLFGDFFGVQQAGGPGRHFQDFFGISGPEGPRDPCKRRAGSQLKDVMRCDHFWRFSLRFWPKKITSCDGCFLLIEESSRCDGPSFPLKGESPSFDFKALHAPKIVQSQRELSEDFPRISWAIQAFDRRCRDLYLYRCEYACLGKRPISGLRPEIGKKSLKIDLGLTRKIGKNRPKIGKMTQKSVFGPFFQFWAIVFPYFPDAAKIDFSATFSDFGPGARDRPSPRHAYSQLYHLKSILVVS